MQFCSPESRWFHSLVMPFARSLLCLSALSPTVNTLSANAFPLYECDLRLTKITFCVRGTNSLVRASSQNESAVFSLSSHLVLLALHVCNYDWTGAILNNLSRPMPARLMTQVYPLLGYLDLLQNLLCGQSADDKLLRHCACASWQLGVYTSGRGNIQEILLEPWGRSNLDWIATMSFLISLKFNSLLS